MPRFVPSDMMAWKGRAVSFVRYLDFELKIARSGGDYSAYVLHSPGGEASHRFELPLSTDRIELLITRMGQRRRFEARRLRSPEMEAACELGTSLFESVFDEGVRDCLRRSLEYIEERPGTGLRIKLRLDDVPELGDLPWELLYDKANQRFLAKSQYTPIVRYLELSARIRPLPLALPLNILVVISSPAGVATLDVEGEKAHLEQALARQCQAGKVRLTYLPRATPRALQRALSIGTYHVLHYIGHGGFDKATDEGVLVLEDEVGKPHIADSQLIGTLIYDHRSLRLVVLNACEGARNSRNDPYAGVATALVQQRVPAVVAMQFEITDQAALTFADELYDSLARGLPVDAAVSEARKAIYSQRNEIEWGTPVLYTRSADGALFQLAVEAPEPAAAGPQQTPERQPSSDRTLDTRLEELYTEGLNDYWLERWVQARRCFRQVVELRTNYKDAAAKLQEVERKAHLSELYEQGVAHMQAEKWAEAHRALSSIVAEQANFRDATTLLTTVNQRKQLAELYEQAGQLHRRQKWQAVVKVFARIQAIDPVYRDGEGFLQSAREQLAAAQRQAELEGYYKRALEAMNDGQWAQARSFLMELESKQPRFRDSKALLVRVERELARPVADPPRAPLPGVSGPGTEHQPPATSKQGGTPNTSKLLGMALALSVVIGLVLGIAWTADSEQEVSSDAAPTPSRAEVFKPTGSATGVQHTALAKKAPMRFIGLTGGTFQMGTPKTEAARDDDEVLHEVQVSPFAIAEKEVTQKQWKLVMGKNPSSCVNNGCSPDRPVQNVSWRDAVEFLNKLSKREKLTPCYNGKGDEIEWNQACTGYRLPTEAEWEYACRAGSQTAYSFGDSDSVLGEYAWYNEDYTTSSVHPVGQRKPNKWGLYDMHGNVWEWVWDWYGPYAVPPSGEAVVDPGNVVKGRSRTLRGGSFGFGSRFLRCGIRSWFRPTFQGWGRGFRAVWARPRQP